MSVIMNYISVVNIDESSVGSRGLQFAPDVSLSVYCASGKIVSPFLRCAIQVSKQLSEQTNKQLKFVQFIQRHM